MRCWWWFGKVRSQKRYRTGCQAPFRHSLSQPRRPAATAPNHCQIAHLMSIIFGHQPSSSFPISIGNTTKFASPQKEIQLRHRFISQSVCGELTIHIADGHFFIDVVRARTIRSIPTSSSIITQSLGNVGVVKTCNVNII